MTQHRQNRRRPRRMPLTSKILLLVALAVTVGYVRWTVADQETPRKEGRP